jgi:hypothetical protein
MERKVVMKKLQLLLLSIITSLLFTGCWPGIMIAAALESTPEKDWANKSVLSELMSNQSKVLLTKGEKQKVANFICLQASKEDKIFTSLAERGGGKRFCNLENEDKIYFFKEFKSSTGLIRTEYLLVIKNEPYDIVEIKRKYSKELGRNIPIIERLH